MTKKHHSTAPQDNEERSKTRVCIKNLPPHYTENDLRRFLVQQLDTTVVVTDCRLLKQHNNNNNNNNNNQDYCDSSSSSRRLAFCGFSNEAQAAACVDRLHRSYCQTSRLVVEYARRPRRIQRGVDDMRWGASQTKEQPASPDTTNTITTTTTAASNITSSKLQQQKKAKLDQRKLEFLAVMGAGRVISGSSNSTGRKFWANDDEEEHLDEPGVAEDDDASHQNDDDDDSSSSSNDSSRSSSDDDADPLQKSSDMDFLRSKQMPLDNLDDNETAEIESVTKLGESSSNGIVNVPMIIEESADHLLPEIDDDDNNNDGGDEGKTSEQKGLCSNRLFLRNLPFTTKEKEVREHFHRFGTILECHIPADDQGHGKGFGFVSFHKTADAAAALSTVDGTDFQGRLLHIIPARQAPSAVAPNDDEQPSATTYKDRMEKDRQATALTQAAGSGGTTGTEKGGYPVG
jgi:multiple RNA-binding domain-containing protein 1